MSNDENATPDGPRNRRTPRPEPNECWLILNPTSGTADHIDQVRQLGANRGYHIMETDHEGHAIALAREAVADGADLLAVAGGDGRFTK